MLQDLKEEYLDAPTEISSGSRAQQQLSLEQKEKQEYEENYLVRLPVTKAEKHRQRKLTTLGKSTPRSCACYVVPTNPILYPLQALLAMRFLAKYDASRRNAAMDPVKNVNWLNLAARARNVVAKSEKPINPLSYGGQIVSFYIYLSFTIILT